MQDAAALHARGLHAPRAERKLGAGHSPVHVLRIRTAHRRQLLTCTQQKTAGIKTKTFNKIRCNHQTKFCGEGPATQFPSQQILRCTLFKQATNQILTFVDY